MDGTVGVADKADFASAWGCETLAQEGIESNGLLRLPCPIRRGAGWRGGGMDARHIVQIAKIVSNDGLYQLLAACVEAVRLICAGIVHKEDSRRACGVVAQEIKDSSMGVDGIVAITVAGRNGVAEEGNHLRLGRGEVHHPADAARRRRVPG